MEVNNAMNRIFINTQNLWTSIKTFLHKETGPSYTSLNKINGTRKLWKDNYHKQPWLTGQGNIYVCHILSFH